MLGVAQMGDAADPLSARVVDSDPGTDVAVEVEGDRPQVPALGEQRLEGAELVEALVAKLDQHQWRC
jgi:hypothetical protein